MPPTVSKCIFPTPTTTFVDGCFGDFCGGDGVDGDGGSFFLIPWIYLFYLPK